MANYSIPQILDMVHKAKTRDQKSQILKDNDEFGLQAILQTAFHPEVEWLLPKGTPPYAAMPPANDTPKALYSEVKKFYLFTKKIVAKKTLSLNESAIDFYVDHFINNLKEV